MWGDELTQMNTVLIYIRGCYLTSSLSATLALGMVMPLTMLTDILRGRVRTTIIDYEPFKANLKPLPLIAKANSQARSECFQIL